jgi:phosphatidylserine decarboxylase
MVLFVIYFFRDPERLGPQSEWVIVSPADGRITTIEVIKEHKYLQSDAIRLSIFLSPFNVHVNRIPHEGTVEYIHYFPWAHHMALYKKSSEKNEHSEFGLMTVHGKIMFRQIAGIVAQRIVHELTIGDEVKTWDRFGMILFGSRMDIIVPPHWICKVRVGQKVRAGQTILFTVEENV